MTTLFAPPELLSAWSYAVDGSDPEETLPPGTHLRVFGGMGPSFPLAPFAVFKLRAHEGEAHRLVFTDDRGSQVDPGNLASFGGVDLFVDFGNTETTRAVRAELRDFNPGALQHASLLDSHGRIVAARGGPRFLFAAPTLSRFRLRGDASNVQLISRMASIADLVPREGAPQAIDLLGLPVPGAHRWYFGVHDGDDGLNRVSDGAPQRLNPTDQPDGPFDPVSPGDEQARVEALLASHDLGGGVEGLLETIVDDGGIVPWRSIEKQNLGDRDQVAYVPRLATIQTAALDPGLGRFLGFATRVGEIPDLDGDQGWNALGVVALLAIDPELGKAMPHLAAWLSAPDPDEGRLIEILGGAIADLAGLDPGDVRAELDQLIATGRDVGLVVRAMVAVTAPVPPWQPPQLAEPAQTDHRWHSSDGVTPSRAFRTTFAFAEPPLSSLVAIAAELDGSWVSRHDDIAGLSPPRKAPRVLGHEGARGSSMRASLKPGGSLSLQASGLIADERIPADPGSIRYRFQAADLFGRFGPPTDTQIEPPARPNPPPPVLRYQLELDPSDPADLPPTGSLSPGNVRLTFVVPQPVADHEFDGIDEAVLRTAIVVPGLATLAAGSLPIEFAMVAVSGSGEDVDLSSPGVFEASFALPELDPQASAGVTLSATFRDVDGRPGEESQLTFTIRDRRPPPVVETGVGLFWTSAPGPSPHVQLRLGWDTAPNTRSRVYMTDALGLGLAAADLVELGTGLPASRGRVAQIGANRVLSGPPVDRKAFRLLTDDVRADAGGHVTFEATLPRSLETVQFLRIVPLNAEGGEAAFDKCGIVPVAVPDSRRPALPRLDASVDPQTGEATLTVLTDAFDAVALKRDEPGLFNPAVGEAMAPRFRIKRAAGPVEDPVYARQVVDGDLELSSGSAVPSQFRGSATDTNDGRGLEPYVRYVYWADVQLPPERRLPVGVVPLDAGVAAADPASAGPYPRPTSLPSPARTVMRVPSAPRPPTAQQVMANKTVAANGGVLLEISITDPPTVHPRAVGRFRLAAWTHWPNSPIEATTRVDGTAFDDWPALEGSPVAVGVTAPQAPATTSDQLRVRLGYVDPIGRLGPLVELVV
jgi:hypothetical protein